MNGREEVMEWPHLEQYSDVPMFNTKAVVQQTSVPAPTLRAWERRYTLLSPERADNTYRLYSERDVVMIRWLKERVDGGMAISQAIALWRHLSDEQQTLSSPIIAPSSFHVAYEAGEQEKKASESEWQIIQNWPHIGDLQPLHDTLTVNNMRIVRERLIEAFRQLDEGTAHTLLASMLAIYPVERICTELITPTMWQVGYLWAEDQVTVSVEHFASNFFRALLTNLFHVAPTVTTGSLVLVASAPGEPHELAALMLALFLRRSGMRVAYLGQSIETNGLLHTIKKLSPSLICISLTMPSYLSALIDLGAQISAMPAPRPIFAFGGQVFTHYPHVIEQVSGVYLDADLLHIVAALKNLVKERPGNQN